MPALPLDAFRARFPILGRRVYVNSCSQGALSTEQDVDAVLEALDAELHNVGAALRRPRTGCLPQAQARKAGPYQSAEGSDV